MAKIKIIIEDDNGKQIDKEKVYELEIGEENLSNIESAVEKFKQKALPEIEKKLMLEAQKKYLGEKKT